MSEYKEIEFNGLLTKEEFFKLVEAVRRDGKIDETEAERLTDWSMKQITNAELVKLMIEGFLVVRGWDNKGNPLVEPTQDAIVAMDAIEEKNILEASVLTV